MPRRALLTALFLVAAVPPALAQDAAVERAPLPYRATLTDAAGGLLPDGPLEIVFRAYAGPDAAGAPLWEEVHEVALRGGRFEVMLGEREALPPGDAWLTVAVGGEPESAAVPLGAARGAAAAPGNTLQDSYDNGHVIDTGGVRPVIVRGLGNDPALRVDGGYALFTDSWLGRIRFQARDAAQNWEFRAYGYGPLAGFFTIADLAGSRADAFQMAPGVADDLLRLEGAQVHVGSSANPATLGLHTLGAPGPTVLLGDAGDGSGGALALTDEAGALHAFLSPDADGGGGFLGVLDGTGAYAFSVDGNYLGTNQTRVRLGGANPMVFDTSTPGDGAVSLPADAVQSAEILNEAGVAAASAHNSVQLEQDYKELLAATLHAPTDGFVLATGIAEVFADHTTGDATGWYILVSDRCGESPGPVLHGTPPFDLYLGQTSRQSMSSSAPTMSYQVLHPYEVVVAVNEGPVTLCVIGSQALAPEAVASVRERTLTLLFVPTAYGPVSTLHDPTPEGGGDPARPALAPRAASETDVARLEAELDRVRAMVEALRDER